MQSPRTEGLAATATVRPWVQRSTHTRSRLRNVNGVSCLDDPAASSTRFNPSAVAEFHSYIRTTVTDAHMDHRFCLSWIESDRRHARIICLLRPTLPYTGVLRRQSRTFSDNLGPRNQTIRDVNRKHRLKDP